MTPDLLSAETLLQGYAAGVFPMAESSTATEIFWVDPRWRGIMPLDGFHISRSLAKYMRRGTLQITIDTDFTAVVTACADREETWINPTIFKLYGELFEMGFAHAIEVREAGALVGGIYGVALGGAFFGESMFSRRTNASKVAMAYLVDRLRRGGFLLFDTQFVTDHLRTLGAVEIPRHDYRRRLSKALEKRGDFSGPTAPIAAQDVLQRNTQISYRR